MENISYSNQKKYSQEAISQTSKNDPPLVSQLASNIKKADYFTPELQSLSHSIPVFEPLCNQKITTTVPSLALNINITGNSDINAQIAIGSIFSPKLTPTEWNEQLRCLQQQKAQICGLDLDDYTGVFVQDLSLLDPSESYPWKYFSYETLIVVHGNCPRKVPLSIPNEVTVIGSDTLIHIKDTAWALMIPKAYIYPHPDLTTTTDHKTGLCKDLPYLIEPDHPMASLSLLGVQLEGSNITKVMQADCGMVTLKNNTITGTGGIEICSECKTIVQGNIIPTYINIDCCGYPEETSSFTQGVKTTCVTYIGGCSSRIGSEVQMLNHEDLNDTITSKDTSTRKLSFFSPNTSKEDWQRDLLSLQQHKAKISGLATSKFNNVDVVDLATIDPEDMTHFLNTKPEDLIIVYGECGRKAHLPISGGATLIGSEAIIDIPNEDGDFTYTLNIPRAEITIYANERSEVYASYGNNVRDNRWIIGKNDSVINTNAANIVAGAYPLVYLDASNLIGVTIIGFHMAQCIVGSSVDGTGEIIIADCTLASPKKNSLFLHDCSKVTVVNNEFESHDYEKYPPVFYKCETILWQNNKEDRNPYFNHEPMYVPLFVRGEVS